MAGKARVTKDFSELKEVKKLKKGDVAAIEYSIPSRVNGEVLSVMKDSLGKVVYTIKNEDGRTINVKADWVSGIYVE